MQKIFSLCCQDLARDLFMGPTKQGNQIMPFLCYLLGLGGTKFVAIFRNTLGGKLMASRWEVFWQLRRAMLWEDAPLQCFCSCFEA